jgi:uncharacterized repeat protein (TIGR03803 family)
VKLRTIEKVRRLVLVTCLALFCLGGVGRASDVKVLYTFKGGVDGLFPWGPLVRDKQGNLYGTTQYGGSYGLDKYFGFGTVFQLSPSPSGWVKTTIYEFKSRSDGSWPASGLVIDPEGNLYGASGTVFELSPSPTGWIKKTLHVLKQAEGVQNYGGGLAIDSAGNLFGTTGLGGPHGYGAVYKLARSGARWKLSNVYGFQGVGDGCVPQSAVTLDSAGNLYGTTYTCGSTYGGVVYKLSPSGSGWTETVLHTFSGGLDGLAPVGGVVLDGAGNIYGTTSAGNMNGMGVVYELSPSGDTWNETILHNFSLGDGMRPLAGLALSGASTLYGATAGGGAGGCVFPGCGTLFELSLSGNNWTENTLYDFTGVDGNLPVSNLLFDQGNLYGVTLEGGIYGAGVVFEITP